jgi:hypothetical protein
VTIRRRDLLLGSGGVAVGALGHYYLAGETEGTAVVAPKPPEEPGQVSFAQSGEDIITGFIFDHLGIRDVSYLDIGAYDPILINNTYYFYRKGHRGVLVEPNVTMCERLNSVRPEDTTLAAGIGVTAVTEADYYVMSEPSWSTFSREEAEHQEEITNGEIFIKEVRTLPLLNVNDVMEEHFGGAPTFLSVDAEGWHLAILESIDYRRFRPKAICVETLVSGSNATIPEIPALMESKGYVARGGSFVNTIFVDSGIL